MWTLDTPTERFFSPDERRRVAALFDAILPGDSTSPGATDADAAEYVDRLLAMDTSFYYEIAAWRRAYRAGLPALDESCRSANGGRGLDACTNAEITSLLSDLAANRLAGLPAGVDQRGLFSLLRAHCIEGCYADPRWGGNRDAIIWRWYGFFREPHDMQRDSAGKLSEV